VGVEQVQRWDSRGHFFAAAAKDEGHGFLKTQNEDFQLYATVLFIQQFLLN